MVCPRCGYAGELDNGRCSVCGAAPVGVGVAAGVIQIDTTGLPPGATFGPTIGLNEEPAPIGTGTGAGAGTATGTGTGELGTVTARAAGPLKAGQAFGPRY